MSATIQAVLVFRWTWRRGLVIRFLVCLPVVLRIRAVSSRLSLRPDVPGNPIPRRLPVHREEHLRTRIARRIRPLLLAAWQAGGADEIERLTDAILAHSNLPPSCVGSATKTQRVGAAACPDTHSVA